MTTDSYTGSINTNEAYESIETLTELTFTVGNTYAIQVQNIAEVKVADAEFTINSITPFNFTQGDDTIYIRTHGVVVLTILDLGVIGGGGGSYTLPTASTTTKGGVKVDGTTITINEEAISATVDSALSSTSEYPVQNKVVYPALNGFLPKGTVISIKTDGTGDFTKLSDAISYLTGKWSNGNVNISLGSGTFTETALIEINATNFSIPLLIIQGQGIDTTTLNFNYNSYVECLQIIRGARVSLINLTIQRQDGTKDTDLRGAMAHECSTLYINTVKFNGCNFALASNGSSNVMIINNLSVYGANIGVHAQAAGRVGGNWAASTTFNNVGTAFNVTGGGFIGIPAVTYTATNVTNKTSQTIGESTSQGLIALT